MSQQNVNTAAKESENTSGLKAAQLSIFDVPGIAVKGDQVVERRKQPALSAEGARKAFIRVFRRAYPGHVEFAGGQRDKIPEHGPPVVVRRGMPEDADKRLSGPFR